MTHRRPSKGSTTLQPGLKGHLRRHQIDLWKPEAAAGTTAHLLACSACRRSLGERVLLRGLLRDTLPRVPGPHPDFAQWERFHDFLILGNDSGSLAASRFIEMLQHLEDCETCFETFFQVHEIRKASPSGQERILEIFSRPPSASPQPPARIVAKPPQLLGTIRIILTPKGVSAKFVPKGSPPFPAPSRKRNTSLGATTPLTVDFAKGTTSKIPLGFTNSNLPFELEGRSVVELKLNSGHLRIRFTQSRGSMRLELQLQHSSSDPDSYLEMHCTPLEGAGRPSGLERTRIGKTGPAVLTLPTATHAAHSLPESGLQDDDRWLLRFEGITESNPAEVILQVGHDRHQG